MVQRKWLVVTLAIVLGLASFLTACSKNDNSPGKEEGAAASKTPKSTGESAAGEQKERVKISILSIHANSPYVPTVTNWADDPYVKELSRLSGYDLSFDFLDWDNMATDTTARFASGDLPDLVRTFGIDSPNHKGALEQGVFTDLTDLIEQYGPNIKKSIPDYLWDAPYISRDGRIFAIPGLVPNADTKALYIRQDWLEKAGLPMPETLDDWLAYFEAVKNTDMNGNGEKDEYGFLVRETLGSSEMFLYEFGVFPNWWKMVGDNFEPTFIQPEMKDAIRFWKLMYDKGYINPDAFTMTSADWIAGIQNGKAGSWGHYVDNYASHWHPGLMVGQPDAKVVFAEPPPAKDGTRGLENKGQGTYFVWVIPSKVKHPEEIVKFFDWAWSSPDAQNFFNFGIEGVNYTKDGDKIVYDPEAPVNKDNSTFMVHQLILNMTGHAMNSTLTLPRTPIGDEMRKGFEIAKNSAFMDESMFMPQLPAITDHPELAVAFIPGSLFLDMFAKTVTGREDVDAAFDAFVADWRKRGGDEWIQQATEWHKTAFK